MSVTLDIPDQLAELLRTLAQERGVSVEELGRQALATGLTTLAGDVAAEIVASQSLEHACLPARWYRCAHQLSLLVWLGAAR
jgi:hypothetical protein